MKNFKISLLLLLFSCLQQTQFCGAAAPSTVSAEFEYIEKFRELAVAEMLWSNFPASVKMAQAILESRSGRSFLAREGNNHFGIKCKIDWKGETIYANDDAPGECFRKYAEAAASFNDHSRFVKYHRLDFYDELFDLPIDDYKGWCRGLKKNGYATAPHYDKTLISIIERYRLYELDWWHPASNGEIVEYHLAAVAKKTMNPEIKVDLNAKVAQVHTLKKGETLAAISNKYGVPLGRLQSFNRLLENEFITEGTEIYLNKPKP